MDIRKNILNKYYIEVSRAEYEALPEDEWIKQRFCDASGGYVAAHRLKVVDDLTRSGIVAEVKGCYALAEIGKHVLRLPENIPDLLDEVMVDGKPYRELLKFKVGEKKPRGYPDVYFDGQTWDFKTSKYRRIKSVRKLILDGRKADNVLFIITEHDQLELLKEAIHSEVGSRVEDGSWIHLPNVYYVCGGDLALLWHK